MLIRMFVLKLIIKKEKILTHHEIHHYRKNCVNDHSSVQRNKIVDSSELMAAKLFIYLFL